MALITDEQAERVKERLYAQWGTCYNCMPYEKGSPVWIVPNTELADALYEAVESSGVSSEVTFDFEAHVDELISELELSCPNCGTDWLEPYDQIGRPFVFTPIRSRRTPVTLRVPTINDTPLDFDKLFQLWDQVQDDALDVTVDFTHCRFLRQNAVAFLGGLARLIENRSGRVIFNWDTLSDAIRTNLAQNGFLAAFGNSDGPWRGNSIPYREDLIQDPSRLMDYLKTKWLGRGWVHVSTRLRDVIVGRVWEIYANAFEHSESTIGVFSCGQHYPRWGELKLTIVDFGVGIPSNVRLYKGNLNIPAEKALEWAFRRGTTTKPNGMGRGLGLDILKQFVRLNKGRLEIFSHEAYGLIDEHQETYHSRQYQLASEDNDEPLF